MRYIALGNVAVWVLGLVHRDILSYVALDPALVLRGQIWRLFTFLFIPYDMSFLGLITVYLYYWIGSTLEQHWGTGQFTIYFFSGALLTVVGGFLMLLIPGAADMLALTPTYVYMAMFFAFAMLFPDVELLLFFIIPVKIKYLAWLDAALFVLAFITTPFPLNLLPVLALLNFAVFFGGDILRGARSRRTTKSAVNFRRESQRIRREQAQQLYRHKCAVCGRTDTDYPELEFRYCSRCQGYHCFCQDHIDNHVHFTE
ncbi:MAG: rhomboid family intramembrane serine protease [Oscillospiraceae bacterium]|nr:rhomboid family intramembrane serine protease [Oscillospiraceae bacterium]